MSITLDEFIQSVTASDLMDAGEIQNFIDTLPMEHRPETAEDLAREMYRAGKLTKFQAQAIYQKKTRGLVVGNYVVLDKLGKGGMGAVYKAQHKRMKRIVALKMLPSSATKSSDSVKRFQQEVEAAARLTHPNIVTAHDADEAKGVHFLVMEYVEGQDLYALVKGTGTLSVARAVDYTIQAAKGLQYAHSQGVIHRDIKPHNLLLDKAGTVKILDMGLARIEERVARTDAAADEGLTQSGQVMGTLDYMPPEQALDTRAVDVRADIYSLGCTLHYLLVGRPPYPGDTVGKKMLAHRVNPIPSLRELRSDVPQSLDTVFQKMMAKEPKDRQQTMTEVITELQGCTLQDGNAPATFPPSSGSYAETVDMKREDTAPPAESLSPLDELFASEPVQITERLVAPSRRYGKRWTKQQKMLVAAVAGGVTFVLLLSGIILTMRTSEGTLVVEINEPDATVQVLNEQGTVLIERKGQKGTLTIGVDPGKRRLRVEKEGFEVFAKEFAVASGGKETVKAKLEPKLDSANVPKPLPIGQWVPLLTSPDDYAKWTPLPITKDVKPSYANGVLTVPNHGVICYPSEIRDAAIRAKARLVSGESVGLYLRCGEDSWYCAFFNGFGFGLGVGSPVEGYRNLKTVELRQSSGDFVEFEFSTIGEELRVSINGSAILVANDSTLRHGRPGVGVYNGVAMFKGIELRVPTPNEAKSGTHKEEGTRPPAGSSSRAETEIPHVSSLVGSEGAAPPPAIAPFDATRARQHQEAWAKHLGVPMEATNSIGTKLILIPPGQFMMGSTPEEIERALEEGRKNKDQWYVDRVPSEGSCHRVEIAKPFYLAVYEVTQTEYELVVGSNPSTDKGDVRQAVEAVTWFDAVRFCNRLSERERTPAFFTIDGETVSIIGGNGYRLPTEAEWEYACRAGTTTTWSFGDDESKLGDHAWHVSSSGNKVHTVGKKNPNLWGLYDMHGNVWEWCWDRWGISRYEAKSVKDPMGATDGAYRVLRGGAFNSQSGSLRSSVRNGLHPVCWGNIIGFRLAKTCPSTQPVQPSSPGVPAETAPKPAEPNQSTEEGFVRLFDGKTLNGWQGATDRYQVQDGKIVVDFGPQAYHGQGGHLFTAEEYKDFALRLEYTVSEAANGGILLRAPLGDKAWQDTVEVQILDDSAPTWQRLPPQNLNGSLFNIVAVKPGHLRPTGQWNSLEVQWKGRQVRVTLNGAIVVNTDLDDPSDKVGNGLQHRGLKRERGYIVLMGYASQGKMEFRNIRIKDLSSPTTDGKPRANESDGDDKAARSSPDDSKRRSVALQAKDWIGLPQCWRITRQGIMGSTGPQGIDFNTFLCTKKPYRNFELTCQVRLVTGNTGVQFRSDFEDQGKFVLRGPQVDIGSGVWGNLYGEKMGSTLKEASAELVKRIVKDNAFNDVFVRCVGKHVTIKINNETTVDGDFPAIADEGVIGLQLLSGKTEVVFRNVRLKELP